MAGNDESKSVSISKGKNKNSEPKTTCRFPRLPCLTVEEAFNDYLGRRSGVIKALTTDFDEFLRQCDSGRNMKSELCLYGLPDGEWKVKPPTKLVPSVMPEPTVGINGDVTDQVELYQWLFFVASHSEAWLTPFTLHSFKSRLDRDHLFTMINELPTITEVVKQFVYANKEEFESKTRSKNTHLTVMKAEATRSLSTVATVEEVFNDYASRRAAIIKALTIEVKEFVRQIREKKEAVSLYGHPNGEWELRDGVDGEMMCKNRNPTVGINFGRQGIPLIQWLKLVAFHSDAWLISTAFHNTSHTHFCKLDRDRLFEMINELRTVTETIGESSSKQHEESFCGYCEGKYNFKEEELWICCDYCGSWYHGECVGVTPNRAKLIHKYKCRIRCNKKY